MVGHVQAKHLAFEVELGFLVPLLHVGHLHHGVSHGGIVLFGIVQVGEQVELAFRLLAFQADDRIDGRFVDGEQRTTVRVDRVERAGLDQRFHQSPVQRLQRHAFDEIGEVHVLAVAVLTFRDDRIDRVLADVADGAEAESHDVADCRILVHRLVHVRRKHLDAHASRLAQVQRGLVFVRAGALQQGGHELHRIMRFQIRGPVGDQTVCGRMRLVERVAGERHEDVPHGLRGLFGISMLLHAGEERNLLLGQHFRLLLAHRSTQHVCLAQRIAGEDSRRGLHLLLVDDQTVGLVEHFLKRFGHFGVDWRDLLQTVLALRIVGVRIHIHRTWTVQRDQCGNIVEVVRLQRFQQRAHAVGIELEHAERVATGQQVVGGAVVQRNLRMVDAFLAVRLDVVQGVSDHRQVGKSEEVHLDQTERFARMVFERGGDGAVGTFQQRRRVGDRLAAHDGGAGVHTGLTNQTFDAHRLVRDAFRVRVGIVQFAEFACFRVSFRAWVEDVVQRNVLAAGLCGRQGFGDLVSDGEVVSHDAGGVLQRLLGFDGAVDHALRHFVTSVFLTHVVEHASTTVRVEVDVDIRQ